MCRFIAYLGKPIPLVALVSEPRHSLLRQASHATEAHSAMQGDGFGLGWYGEQGELTLAREATPAWSDNRLLALCGGVRAGLFFAHVRAATSAPVAAENCHPFRLGRHLFMHNGQIGGYEQLRPELEALLPEHLREHRRGGTDSELLFLLAMARMALGEDPIQAVLDVFRVVARRVKRAGIARPLRLSAALSDGQVLYAFRLASDAQPPSLYLRGDTNGTVIASEPLDGDHARWTPVPPGSVVRVTRSAYLLQPADAVALQDTMF